MVKTKLNLSKEERETLRAKIDALPKGTITVKIIAGRPYEYWQYSEDGHQVSRRVKGEELEILKEQIALRKELEAKLRGGKAQLPEEVVMKTGKDLDAFCAPVSSFRRRECFKDVMDYLQKESEDKVLILYGLRRTGMTTLMRQALGELSKEERAKAVFLQVSPKAAIAELFQTMKALWDHGFIYFFIDEITLLEDFIDGAAILADIYASCGAKIILSGTNSLGFRFSADESLYDRCRFIHTTYIPFKEFSSILGTSDIDDYIRYGGTLSRSMERYEEESTFATMGNALAYIDTAIAGNIQHSLAYYQGGAHFRHLMELYEAGELTGAINRVIADMNHRFVAEMLTKAFRSADFSLSANNLREEDDALDHVKCEEVERRLMTLLEIKSAERQRVNVTEEHALEIKEYLLLLELIDEVDVVSASTLQAKKRVLFTQPGLRYAQAKALVVALLEDPYFQELGIKARQRIQERLLDEIRGRMSEDIVLLHAKKRFPHERVFPLLFPVGEFDMVRFDPELGQCFLYEIKHSQEEYPKQRRHLLDEEKLSRARLLYGDIKKRVVLYRGKGTKIEGIAYENIEDFLKE